MKNLLYLYCITVLLSTSCAKQKAIQLTQNSQYFVGSWIMEKPVLTNSGKPSLTSTFSFSQDGSLRLATSLVGSAQPERHERHWQYNDATKELTTFGSSQSRHVLAIKEASQTQFSAQIKGTKTTLTFRRKA